MARDKDGEVLMATCCVLPGSMEVDQAEALAMRHSMKIAIEAGFRSLVVETDSQKLYNYLSKGRKASSSFGMLVSDIQVQARLCTNVVYSFVRRNGNRIAHKLAKICNDVLFDISNMN